MKWSIETSLLKNVHCILANGKERINDDSSILVTDAARLQFDV